MNDAINFNDIRFLISMALYCAALLVGMSTVLFDGFLFLFGYPYAYEPLTAWGEWVLSLIIVLVVGGGLTAILGFLGSLTSPNDEDTEAAVTS